MGTMEIGIIGSGNVGLTSAFAIAESGAGDILLYDVVDGRARGKALDLAEASPIRRYGTGIHGVDALADMKNAGVLVIAAGVTRKGEQSRTDVLDDNLKIIRGLAKDLKTVFDNDNPPVTIVLSEPVDLLTLAFLKETGWKREKVIGVGGILSASRMARYVADELKITAEDVDAVIVGTHSDQMVPLTRYSRVSGLPLESLLSEDQINSIIDKTVKAGDIIVDMAKRGASFYTPGIAVGFLAKAISRNERRVACVSMKLNATNHQY